MKTLLDHHLATFDRWLYAYLMPLTASPCQWAHYHLTVVTLLDQLDPKDFHWQQVSVILQHHSLPIIPDEKLCILFYLFGRTTFNIEFIRIVSTFLMDRNRAGSLWLNPHDYTDLAMYILKILGDK